MLRTFIKNKVRFSDVFPILIILFCIVGVYFPLFKTFYQQDEWLGFGTYLASAFGYVTSAFSSKFGVLWGEGRMLSSILYYLSFKFFPLNIFPIATFSLIFHSINTLLVYFLAKKIFNKTLPSLLGSLFFALSGVSHGAVTWAGAVGGTLPSTTLILISLFLYFNYIKTNKKKWLIRSFLLIYLSLHFKESGVFLFLLLPFASLIFKKYSKLKFMKTYWYYLLTSLIIVVVRIVGYKSVSGTQSLFLTGTSEFYYGSFVIRSILYPLTSFSLSIIPPASFLEFTRYVTNVYYPFIPIEQFILIAQTAVLDLISVMFSFCVFGLFLKLSRNTKANTKKTVIFWIIFILTSFLPYIIVSKSYSYLDSRYYYLASVGWAVIFGWILNLVIQKTNNNYLKVLAVFGFVLFLNFHVKSVIEDIDLLVDESQTRIAILEQLKELKFTLEENKNVFYITGDKDYLLVGNRVPFQQGFGYTLMTVYHESGKIPAQLLDDGYLFELGSQGYKEIGNYGFGYFSDTETMEKLVKEFKLEKNNINRFYYDSTSKELKRY